MQQLDWFLVEHIFSFLDQKTQVRMTSVCKRFVKLRENIYEIIATNIMTDKQLRLYKNLCKLDLWDNIKITNDGIKKLSLNFLSYKYLPNNFDIKVFQKLKPLCNIKQHQECWGLGIRCDKLKTPDDLLNEFKTHDWWQLQFETNPTNERCLEAVKQNGMALEYVKHQTLKICLEAVHQDYNAVEFVNEMYLEKIKQNLSNYIPSHVIEKFDKDYLIAKKRTKTYELLNVKKQTKKICMEVVKQYGMALECVKNQTPEICLEAVRQNGMALKYVKNQTEEICLEAVKQYGYALKYVKNQTEEICLEAVKQYGYALKYVKNQTEEICFEAVKRDVDASGYVKNKTLKKYLQSTE